MDTYEGQPMRDVLLKRLPTTAHGEFLVYVMGPYTTFRVEYLLRDDVEIDNEALDLGAFGDVEAEMQDELREVVEWLRRDLGVNAFLAVDVDIPTMEYPDETDADRLNVIAQSKAYAAASNAVVFILPTAGVRDGVDIEIGAVLAGLGLGHDEGEPARSPQRFHVFREHGVRSATLNAVPYEYEVALTDYGTRSELSDRLRRFVASVVRAEQRGDLSSLDAPADSDTDP